MNTVRNYIFIALISLSVVVLQSCPKKDTPQPTPTPIVVNPTPGATPEVGREIAIELDRFAFLIKQARETRDQIQAQGWINKEEARVFTQYLSELNKIGSEVQKQTVKYFADISAAEKKLVDAKARNASADELAQLQVSLDKTIEDGRINLRNLAPRIAEALKNLNSNGTFHIKNPDAQAKFGAIFATLEGVVNSIFALIG